MTNTNDGMVEKRASGGMVGDVANLHDPMDVNPIAVLHIVLPGFDFTHTMHLDSKMSVIDAMTTLSETIIQLRDDLLRQVQEGREKYQLPTRSTAGKSLVLTASMEDIWRVLKNEGTI